MANDIIKKQWTNFRKTVIPPDAPKVQITEMQRAFYAGAELLFYELAKASSEEEEKAHYLFDSIHKELKEFFEKILKKKQTH